LLFSINKYNSLREYLALSSWQFSWQLQLAVGKSKQLAVAVGSWQSQKVNYLF
jgi:hypothetical protein